MEEGGFDEFAPVTPLKDEILVEPDIKCVGEIVSSALYAKETISKAEKAVLEKANFGDLPEQLWPVRMEQERKWMAPGPEDTIHDLSSQLLPHADRTIVIGTNGVYSFALECADDTRVQMDPEITGENRKKKTKEEEQKEALKKLNGPEKREDRVETIDKFYAEYAKKNVGFAFKRSLSNFERQAFYMALKFDFANLHIVGDAKVMLERLMDMARVDNSLRSPISKLGPRLTKKMNTLPARFERNQKRPVSRTADRPDGAFPTVKFMTIDFHEPVQEVVAPDLTTFRLLICPTPTLEQHKKKKKKQPHWVDVNLAISTDAKTVPACAFNDTHFVILYLPFVEARNGVLIVNLYELPSMQSTSRKQLTKVDCFYFCFPPELANEGMLNIHLSQQGVISVCFANGVLVFDAFRQVPQIHVLLLEAVKCQRRITTSPIFHPPAFKRDTPDAKDMWCGTVVLGTDKGECYGINWRTGFVHFIEVSPAVEPIFATHYSNGKIFMQTVMTVCGTISNLSAANQLTVLPIDRPLAMDSCGALIVVLSKYGFIKILSSIARQVAREFPQPSVGSHTPLLQHAYKGVKAFHDHIVCVYPSGLVRNLVLGTME